jgi:transposase
VPAQEVAAAIVAELAGDVLGLKERIRVLEEELEQRFSPVRRLGFSLACQACVRSSGPCFLVAVCDISAFESADRLAAYDAALVPAARESGKRVGNHRRMRGANKVLKRIFYQSAFASLRNALESRAFYDRKRAEGKRHTQALVALARRRVNVLWAMLRDCTTFETRSAA